MPRHTTGADHPRMAVTAGTATPGGPVPVGRYWWVPLVAGILSIGFGLAALVWPGPTLLVVAIIVGAYLAAWGVMAIVRAIGGGEDTPPMLRVLLALIGILSVLAGLLALVRPEESVLAIAWIVGFWWVLVGVLEFAQGLVIRERRGANLALGALGIAAGAIILAQPEIGLITLVWIVGIGLIVQGGIEVVAGWALRQAHKEGLA
jgi:uncharacterized membrane protein HdeD (DUF308 family)